MRIVSLVPSLTETLVEFGLASSLVGRTRWCTEPAALIAGVETIGGTKNPDVARILELAPDLVIVNKEENRLEDCLLLEAAGLSLHVTHPRTVAEAADMLARLGLACGAAAEGQALAQRCRAAVDAAGARVAKAGRLRPTFCPIWRRPWMTFRRATYIGDMLELAGCANVFGAREGADFFEVTLDDILRAKPVLVVLPDEPYAFEKKHAGELTGAGLGSPCLFVDGKDLSWYGPRIPGALERLSQAVHTAT